VVEAGVRKLMDAIATALITAVVGVLGGYILGNLRLKYEHLHERRAGVIARLCELLAAVQRGVVGFTYYLQRGDADRHEQAQEASRSFFELVDYYRANEVWLEPNTCKKIETFMDNVYLPLVDYFDDLDERGYPQSEEGAALGLRIVRETQPLRRELISEFRMILYPQPWSDYPLRFLGWLRTRNRKDASGE
jgi:hypothetical protein